MTFTAGALRVFDRTGRPVGSLRRVSITAPRTYRLNDVEDMAFRIPRADGPDPIITAAGTPPYVGATTFSNGSTTTTALTPHANTDVGDVVIVVAAYDMLGAARTVSPPSGWQVVGGTTGGADYGMAVWARRRTATDTSYTFTASTIAPTLYSVLSYRNVYRLAPFAAINNFPAASSWAMPKVVAPFNNEWLINISAGNAAGTWTPPTGNTGLTAQSVTGVSLGVSHRVVARGVTPALSASPSASMNSITASLVVQETPSVEAMLSTDNIVLIQNDIAMRPWAGVIQTPEYGNDGVDVRCLGMVSLFEGINLSITDLEESQAAYIAEQIVRSVNASKVTAGDLQIGFVKDGSVVNHGKFSAQGDALSALQSLQRDSISDFWMDSYIDPATGYLKTDLHWNSEIMVDRKTTVIRDGPGGNLISGATVQFDQSDTIVKARLIGAETRISDFIHYGAVQNVIREITPQASVTIANEADPNLRRRESTTFAVNWSLSEAEQRAKADEVEGKYLALYKSFLYAHHQRWGAPFLPGYEWSGPKPGEHRRLSMENVRSTRQFAYLKPGSIIQSADLGRESEVAIQNFTHDYDLATTGVIGIALDYNTLDDRLLARKDGTVARLDPRSINDPTTDPRYTQIVTVVQSGETLKDIATDAARPTSVWVLATNTSTLTGYVREYDLDSWTLVNQWSFVEPATYHSTGLAVNVADGRVYLLDNGATNFSARVRERQIDTGTLLKAVKSINTSYWTTALWRGYGLSYSGGVLYVCMRSTAAASPYSPVGSAVLRFFAADVDDLGSTTQYPHLGEYPLPLSNSGENAVGVLADPVHSQFWVPRNDGSITAWYANVAIATVSGASVADGAPGFDQVTRASFAQIIFRDSRAALVQSPSAYRPKHLCQLGRVVNGVWTKWGTQFDGYNCTMAAAAMALDRHTEGKKKATPPQMRSFCGDFSGGTDLNDAKRAWYTGWGETLHVEFYATFSRLVSLLKVGRGVIVQGDWDQIPQAYTCQSGYGGDHAIYINEVRSNGDFLVYDPLCAVGRDAYDKSPKWIPQRYIFRYGQKFTGRSGTLHLAYTKDTVGPASTTVTAKPSGYFGDWPGPAGIDQFMWGLAQQESGGNYCAVNGTSGAYGKYQIMPANWPSWGQTYLHHNGVRCCNTATCKREQDLIARGKLSDLYQSLNQYPDVGGPRLEATKVWRRVAHWWLTGSKSYPESTWSDFSTRYVNNVMALKARAPGPSASTAPTAGGRAYVVWADGWWVNQIVDGDLPGEYRLEKTWYISHNGTQSGFNDDVILAQPEQVVYGEEGRVNDWDPTSMGYGVNGYRYVNAFGGAGVRTKGWYHKQWDIAPSYFWFTDGGWSTGEEYLTRLVTRANRAQGAQEMEVLNRADLWTKIELGGLYTFQQGEQGPKPGGISGTIRVVGFSPDEASGAMQVLAEWVG